MFTVSDDGRWQRVSTGNAKTKNGNWASYMADTPTKADGSAEFVIDATPVNHA